MSLFVPIAGTVIFLPDTGPKHDPKRPHRFVVLTNPCPERKNLAVPICTQHNRCDRTCLLGPSDHKEIIKVSSFIEYHEAKIFETSVLMKLVNDGDAKFMGVFEEKLFGFIASGLERSDMTRPRILEYYRKQRKN